MAERTTSKKKDHPLKMITINTGSCTEIDQH